MKFRTVTVLVGVLLAAWFYRPVGNLFKDVVRTENLALFLGFSLIFVGTSVGILVIWFATRFMKRAKLQWADRLPGQRSVSLEDG